MHRAGMFGIPAMALTDVENLYGQVRFHRAARSYGIKPITGVELRAQYQAGTLGCKSGRLVLLARDRLGYESLCRIITRRRSAVRQRGYDPLDCLKAEPSGMFFLSDDASLIEALLQVGVAATDIRFLLVRPGNISHDIWVPPRGVRTVADPDIVMAGPADRDLHLLRMTICRRQEISELNDAEPCSLAPPLELRALYRDVPEALTETLDVAEECNFDLGDAPPVLPSFELPAGETAEARLAAMCWTRLRAAQHTGRCRGPRYEERLRQELSVVERLGYAGYFLIMAEIADHARQLDIAVAGRGSAAGSLMAHLLALTAVDPIERGLYFERFLNPARKELPDIDLDVASDRRDALIDWVYTRFGEERVAMVSAHQTMRRRGAFRAGLKALGMRPAEVDRFCQRMPADELEEELLPLHLLPGRYRAAVPLIGRLVGRFQHLSVHPGGVVIAEPPIDSQVPLERAPKGVRVTQFDKRGLAAIGLVKFDLLGNRALTAIAEIRRRVGAPLVASDADPATLETVRAARTVGCFQIETPALRATLRRLPVRGIADLIGALAIVRPGPAAGEAKAAYLRRANGTEAPQAPHPRLAALLRETHGMMLYEEDLMASIAAMTGSSLEAADDLRAAIVRADNAATLAGLERDFVAASVQSGVMASEALAVWLVLARFAAYSFNKAHAASYAELAWQSAYLKTHYPVEFAAAVLNSYGGHYPLRTVAGELARCGVRLLAPHVNFSETACTAEAGAVRVGLSAVKRLTAKSRRLILDRGPFTSLADLLARVAISHRELEALVLCGACDALAPLAEELYPFAHQDVLERLREERSAGVLEGFVSRRAYGARAKAYRSLVRIRNELRFLEMHLTDHPMHVLRDEAARVGCITTAELAARRGAKVRIAGLVAAARRLVTRGGRIMQFVTLEDEHGLVETVLFPDVYASLQDPVTTPGPFIFGGRVEDGEAQLHVSEVIPFYLRARPE
ncbi:MAG: DNA polymerase III subunit alpha [Pseudomonadota bacterium]|nr:DNA polymerase III subunit alpha [Pseudomonadota bacterium]